MLTTAKIPRYGIEHPWLFDGFMPAIDDPEFVNPDALLSQITEIASFKLRYYASEYDLRRALPNRRGNCIAATALLHTLISPIETLTPRILLLKNNLTGRKHAASLITTASGSQHQLIHATIPQHHMQPYPLHFARYYPEHQESNDHFYTTKAAITALASRPSSTEIKQFDYSGPTPIKGEAQQFSGLLLPRLIATEFVDALSAHPNTAPARTALEFMGINR